LNPSILFSTLADEALDIPRLDSIFLVFPQRNPGLIEQQIGRICREHPAKQSTSVFDFVDNNVGPLNAQWMVRRKIVYEANDYDIHVVTSRQIMDY
jgi:superfamily II DNA or RNA helicase